VRAATIDARLEFCASGPYFIRFISESTFLKPDGTANRDSSAGFEEKLLISVVISSSDPGAL
jgi:hypothetical protein